MLLSCDISAWNQYFVCDIWYITSIFGLRNEETKLKCKTANFKHFTANFLKLMVYRLCWCCIRCLLDSFSKFVSLSIWMKLLNRRRYTDLWNCLSSGIMELYFYVYVYVCSLLRMTSFSFLGQCEQPPRLPCQLKIKSTTKIIFFKKFLFR